MGLFDIFTKGHERGEREREKRTQNSNRVESGKKQVRAGWKNVWKNYEQDVESLEILKRNTGRYLDREDEIAARDWALGEEGKIADYEGRAKAYNQSVDDFYDSMGLIDISNNIAIEEEANYMDDFHTKLRYEALEAQYALDDSMTKIGFDEKKADYALSDRMIELGFEADKARLDIDVAMNKGASERELKKLENKAKHAESAFDSQSDIIKGMHEKGKIRAKGGAGRSSRKAMQSVEAGVGMRQAMRVDALVNSNSVFRNQLQASYDNVYYQKRGFKSKLDTIDVAAATANRDYRFSREQTGYAAKSTQRDYGLGRAQAADTLRSGLRANETRMKKMAASKYSSQLQVRKMVHDLPTLEKESPKPFKSIRPEFQEIEKPSKKDFYDEHMPHLEDENKIVGYEGREPWWQTGLEIGATVASAAVAGYAPGLASGEGGFSWSAGIADLL